MRIALFLALALPCAAQYPNLSGFTWVQQETGVLTQSPGAPPILSYTNQGNGHEMMLLTSLPAPPYTVTLGISLNQTDYSKEVSGTLILRDSATDRALAYTTENEMAVTGSGPTCCTVVAAVHLPQTIGVNAQSVQVPLFASWNRIPSAQQWRWIKITDNGTTRSLWSSPDQGQTWGPQPDYSEPSGTYLTPNQAGISAFSLESAAFRYSFTIWQFSVTTP